MEDEKGDVGLAFSGDASQSPVIANSSGEAVLGRAGSGKQVEGSYEEVAGEEVMVEIVGSDVFVDGVSGLKESDSASGEAEELEVNVWEKRDLHINVDASGEEGVRKVEKVEHVAEKQDLGLVESVDSEGDAGCVLPFRGVEVIEFCSPPIGPRVTMSETTESLSASFDKGTEQTCVLVSEEMRIHSNRIVEVVVEEECVVDETDTLHLGNSSTSCLDLFCANSANSHEVANAGANGQDAPPEASFNTNCEYPENVRFDKFAGGGEEIGLVSTSTPNPIHYVSNDSDNPMNLNLTMSATDAATSISGREVLAGIILKSEVSKACSDNVYANGGGNDDAKINEKDIIDEEEVQPCSKLDFIVPSIQSKSQGCVADFNGTKCDTSHKIHEISHTALDFSQEWSPVSKHEEVMSMDIDSTLGFKDGDLSCARNEAFLNPDGDRETDEPIQAVVEVGSPEINVDKANQIKSMSVMDDNLLNTANSSHTSEEEILEPVSGRYVNEPIIDMSDPEVVDEDEVETLPVKIAVQAESSKIDKKVHEGYTAKACIYTSASIAELSKFEESNDCSRKINDNNFLEGHFCEFDQMDIEESEFGQNYAELEVDCRELDLETDETASEAENSKFLMEEPSKYVASVSMNQLGYFSAPENEREFSPFDLVWGKVRSYPWWPGQIFDPSDASERAVKYFKKDSHLVAYFGDRTFAWNDASVLKPFRSKFSQIEKQGNSEAFHNAVNCALDEVSRRVELGLTCSCVPKDGYAKIKTQLVENTGIREESSQRNGVDQSSRALCFEPSELLEYVQDLAPLASSRASRLDLVIAQAQLSAFCHFKGYRLPTEFPSPGELLENDADDVEINDETVASPKHKHILKDSFQSRKERSLTELMGDSPDFEYDEETADLTKSFLSSSGKKRKALDPLAEGLDKKVSVFAAKGSTSTNQSPKPSFKIGECIRRVASQLTGSTSMIKSQIDETRNDGFLKLNEHSERQNMIVSAESSLDEMLFQLQLLAQGPKKEHNFLNRIIKFFSGFRNSVTLNRRGRKNRSATAGVSAEEFEFDDVNDSYWTDRIVQNYSEGRFLHNCENGGSNPQVVPFDAEKYVKPGRKSHSRKRFSTGSYQEAAALAEFDEIVKRRKQESSPAELILNFAEGDNVPSEINLNKMFRRFGPLMESETEVDHGSGRAKVIFKRGSDAEVAHNSAEKFNIFGPMHVNYEIGYSPLISVKILPVAVPPQCLEDPTVMI